MKILMVCTGNTCRSPFAAAYLAHLRPDWTVHSAGVRAWSGEQASVQACELAGEDGLDLSAHRSRSVNDLDLTSYHRVFAMAKDHLASLEKGELLAELAGESLSVSDPFGKGKDSYRQSFAQIRRYLDRLKETSQ